MRKILAHGAVFRSLGAILYISKYCMRAAGVFGYPTEDHLSILNVFKCSTFDNIHLSDELGLVLPSHSVNEIRAERLRTYCNRNTVHIVT